MRALGYDIENDFFTYTYIIWFALELKHLRIYLHIYLIFDFSPSF